MRIATWNVNSLKARLEKVSWWLERARPDVLLMQETKLADAAAPVGAFRSAGYELAHHGEGRWNGVAIASRCGIESVVTNFGEPLRAARTADAGDDEPLAEARMIAAVCGGVRVVSVYAPNGRAVGSEFYEAKLVWYRTWTFGIQMYATAAPTFHRASVRRSRGCARGGWWMSTGGIIRSRVGIRGGTIAPETFIGTSECASIICWRRVR